MDNKTLRDGIIEHVIRPIVPASMMDRNTKFHIGESTSVMPLFVRADHRLVDAYQVGRFLALVRDLLSHPERLDSPADQIAST